MIAASINSGGGASDRSQLSDVSVGQLASTTSAANQQQEQEAGNNNNNHHLDEFHAAVGEFTARLQPFHSLFTAELAPLLRNNANHQQVEAVQSSGSGQLRRSFPTVAPVPVDRLEISLGRLSGRGLNFRDCFNKIDADKLSNFEPIYLYVAFCFQIFQHHFLCFLYFNSKYELIKTISFPQKLGLITLNNSRYILFFQGKGKFTLDEICI